MIIKISQTASNIKQLYDIEGETFYFHGEAGSVSRLQNITLSNQNTVIRGVHHLSKWIHYIPFRYLFGKVNITRVFRLYRNDHMYGSVGFYKQGFFKDLYVITLDSGEDFQCYICSKGSFEYVSIYQNEKQIALVETYLSTNDYKYTHKLYLLDNYSDFADTLSFFVLYYASYRFAKRFHMSQSSVSVKSWSFSKYNNKYHPEWREMNFPNEDFFGKINLFQ